MAKQMTLKAPFTLEGKGLHTGLNVVLTAKPAAENTGIILRRVDLEADKDGAWHGFGKRRSKG